MRLQHLVLATIVVSVFVLPSMASAYDGKALFIEKCAACHDKVGKADPVNPADKAAVVWKKFFQRGRHPEDLSTILTARQMKAVLTYLQEFAADSDRPETAAIPK